MVAPAGHVDPRRPGDAVASDHVAHGGMTRRGRSTRSVAWCSASIWSAPDGSGLLTLDASSIWSDPDGSRRIVWMIKRMIKQSSHLRLPGV
jgi:hypothetical protein